ncbi:MAG: hypothetical protein RDV41_01130 [Planctomycetota bacterium]|nr:hypothetical protein [Planctomycetota bacterium]
MTSARSFSVFVVVVVLAVCAAAFVGCQPRGVYFDVRRPAKLTMPGVKTIAVVDLNCSDSTMDKRAAAYVKEALLNGIRKEKVLNVIDIKTLQERGGQKIDGVITGEVWSTFTTEKDRFETALRTRETTAQDGFLTKVVESQDYAERVPYETVRAFLKVRLTLVTFKGKKEETRAILSESQGYRQKIGGITSGGFFDLFGSSSCSDPKPIRPRSKAKPLPRP